MSTPLTPDEYTSHDGLGLAQLLREGRVTAGDLLEAALAKLEAINPAINAVVIPMVEEVRPWFDRRPEPIRDLLRFPG